MLSFKTKLPDPVACCMFEAIISYNTANDNVFMFDFFGVCVIAPIPVFHGITHNFVVIRSFNTACKSSGLGLRS